MSPMPDLLRRRFDMVASLSQATMQLQKHQQARLSADIDVQRCEMTDAPQSELGEAVARRDAAEDAAADCEAKIGEIEAALDATDREIAALSTRRA